MAMRPFSRALLLASALGLALPAPVQAQGRGRVKPELSDAAFAYVGGTILSILYHELGHALIDVMELPIYGSEEDAADTLAAVITHEIWTEEGARQNAEAFALSWLASTAESEIEVEDFSDHHALDLQRHYRQVCLFYGASPDTREDFAASFELPEARKSSCAEDYAQADRSWGRVLDELETLEGYELAWEGGFEGEIGALLHEEVVDLNRFYSFPAQLSVQQLACGEVNAFYIPDDKTMVICQEFIDYLIAQSEELDL